MPHTNKVEVVISVDDEHAPKLGQVATALQNAGLSEVSTMDAIGAISGLVAEAKIAGLEKVPGVLGVERSRTVFPA
jgi:hypothetical protein